MVAVSGADRTSDSTSVGLQRGVVVEEIVFGTRSLSESDGLVDRLLREELGAGVREVKGPIEVKASAGRRAVPMAFVVRRELRAHQQRTGRDGDDLVSGRTATEACFASTIASRANTAWRAAGLEPITAHEARHCASSHFIAAGLDWKQISTWAGHDDVRQTWNRYGHLVSGGDHAARAPRCLSRATLARADCGTPHP